jgi:hypothetical protein
MCRDAWRALNDLAKQTRKTLGLRSGVHAAKEAPNKTGLNNRERHPLILQTLDFETPAESFAQCVASIS